MIVVPINISALTNFIIRNAALSVAFMPAFSKVPLRNMLRRTTLHPFPPHSKAGRFHFPTHEFDDFLFFQAKLHGDGIERRTVFPCHSDDAVNIRFSQ